MSDIQFQPAYTNPVTPPVEQDIKKKNSFKDSFKNFIHSFANKLTSIRSSKSETIINPAKSEFSVRKIRRFLKKSFLLPLLVLLAFLFLAGYLVFNALSNKPATVISNDGKIEIQKPKAQQTLNKLFLFPLKDDKGKEVSKLKYLIETVELRDEIIVKGQRNIAVKGRTFMIVNLKITNDFNQTVKLNTRDYVRLLANGKNEKLAPEIHNDPVEIQPISTKYTRLGFVINETDKNLSLQVGEINGTKENIKLNLNLK